MLILSVLGGLKMKKNLKSLIWLSVPVLLAVGCAETRRDPSVSYSPALSQSYTPTGSAMPRAYPDDSSNVTLTAPPPGAGSQDWALAQQIQSVLMADHRLDSQVAAVVKGGVVTLRGGVKSNRERERLREEISRVPGVVRVDDQLGAGDPIGLGSGTSQNY
jgi:uncharacterized lipoprotein YajG